MALIKAMEDNVPAKDQQYFLRNENSPYLTAYISS